MRAILLALVLCVAGCASAPYDWVHGSTHRLSLYFKQGSGVCSGTAVGPHAILTAEHCVKDLEVLEVDGREVAIKSVLLDGDDHAILIVEDDFAEWAEVAREPRPGQEVFIIGNPGELRDQYRHGYVSGHINEKASAKAWTTYDINGFFGDSGSGIFDKSGRLVGVVSAEFSQAYEDAYMKVMASLPLAFTAAQWDKATEGAEDVSQAVIGDDSGG